MDYEASEISKELSKKKEKTRKKKEKSQNTPTHYSLNETMECSASEIPCKALKKKRKTTDTQMIPPQIGNDDIVQQMNNQYSVHNVEKNLEMEMKREEDTITGKCKNNNINQNKEHEMMEMENPLTDHNMISLTSQENKDIDQVNMKQNYNIQFDESETNKKKKVKVKMQRYNHEDIIITGCKETIQENSVSSINLPKNTQAKITEKKLVIFELKDVFYQSINDDSTKKEHIEKMGRVEDETIEKRLFWFHPHAIHFFNMCFQNESLDIAIWTTTSKEIATKVIENLVSKASRDRLVFTRSASNCKSQKRHKDIAN